MEECLTVASAGLGSILALTGSVSAVHSLSEPQFPRLQNGSNNAFVTGLL